MRADKENMDDEELGLMLQNEFNILRSIHHPFIIRLRGVSDTDFSQNLSHSFLVLDCLTNTLEDKIYDEWSKELKNTTSITSKLMKTSKIKYSKLTAEVLLVASDIASGIKFIHKNRIIHRDVKPQNVGFDVRGDIKIFDFGISRYLPFSKNEEAHDNRDLYKMTEMIGSLRYMAPEIMTGSHYNLSADIYSFAILFCEMLSCKTPFASFSNDDNIKTFVSMVGKNHKRPSLPKRLSSEVSSMIRRCWSANISERYCLSEVVEIIQSEACFYSKVQNGSYNNRSQEFLSKSLNSVSREDLRGNVKKV